MKKERQGNANIDPLVSGFRDIRATFNPNEQERISAEIVRHAMVEDDTFEQSAYVIRDAVSLIRSTRYQRERTNPGTMILDGIERYLGSSPILCKRLIDITVGSATSGEYVSDTVIEFFEAFPDRDQYHNVGTYLEAGIQSKAQLKGKGNGGKFMFFNPGYQSEISDAHLQSIETRNKIIQEGTAAEQNLERAYYISDENLSLAKEGSAGSLNSSLDIYRQQYGGVTLQELENMESQEEFNKAAFSYISDATSRGDAFWRIFVGGLFFPPQPYLMREGYEEQKFTNSKFMEKIYRFQVDLYSKLILPALNQEKNDLETDARLGEFLQLIKKSRYTDASADVLSFIPGNSQFYESFFELDEGSFSELILQPPYSRIYDDSREFPITMSQGVYSSFVGKFQNKMLPRILENIKSRFGNSAEILEFCKSFSKSVKSHVREDFLVQYDNVARSALRRFRIEESEDELRQMRKISDVTFEKYKESVHDSFVSSEYIPGEIPTLGADTKFTDIELFWGKDKTVIFRIGEESGASYLGKVLPDGKVETVTSASGDLRKRFPYLHKAVEYLVTYEIARWKETEKIDEDNEWKLVEKAYGEVTDGKLEEYVRGLVADGGEVSYEYIESVSPSVAYEIRKRRLLSKIRKNLGIDRPARIEMKNTDDLLDDLLLPSE